MAFTRFHDDPCRIKKQIEQSTGPCRYMLNVPGNGTKPCYMEDPYIRLQKWGGNLRTNVINVESNLKGLNNPLNRDTIRSNIVKSNKIQYPTCDPITDQSRATHPAWFYRNLDTTRLGYLFENPQKYSIMSFQNNVNTRLAERDNYDGK